MRQECCGKPLRTPYCPYCGKRPSCPESLLDFLVSEQELAETRCARLTEKLDPKYEYYKPALVDKHQGSLKTWEAKAARISAWIAFVEAALADLAAKKTIE